MNATPQPHNQLLEVGVTLLIPALILMQLSDPNRLGPVYALVAALSFPVGWGLWILVRERRFNLFAALGVVSVLLTGGIGILELDNRWLAVKEAAIPGILGLVVAASALTQKPLVSVLLYNRSVLDVDRIEAALAERGNTAAFGASLRHATWMLSGSFAFSSVMNYILATWIVTSPAGSAAFNEELGRLTLLSYPMIAIPAMLIMMGILYYLVRSVRSLTGLELGQALRHGS